MNDPERLLDGGSALERELLGSASDDVGSEAAYRRVQRAIGAAAMTTAATGAAAAGVAGASKAKALGGSLLVGKWLVVGATAGTLVAGSAYVTFALDAPPASRAAAPSSPAARPAGVAPAALASPSAVAAPPAPAAPESSATAETAAGSTAPEVTPRASAPALPEVASRPSHEAKSAAIAPPNETGDALVVPPAITVAPASSTPSSAPAESSLAEEVRIVDAARAALARRDPEAALEALARHRREFPGGALRLEAAVLGVRALLSTGRRAEAQAEGARVLAVHPTGPYASHVRALLDGREKP